MRVLRPCELHLGLAVGSADGTQPRRRVVAVLQAALELAVARPGARQLPADAVRGEDLAAAAPRGRRGARPAAPLGRPRSRGSGARACTGGRSAAGIRPTLSLCRPRPYGACVLATDAAEGSA